MQAGGQYFLMIKSKQIKKQEYLNGYAKLVLFSEIYVLLAYSN